MSLTSILSYTDKRFKPFRSELAELFPQPKTLKHQPLKVIAATKNYFLIGKAFDYLIRIALEKRFPLHSYSQEWIAELAIAYLQTKKNKSIQLPSRDMNDQSLLAYFEERDKKTEQAIIKFNECFKIYEGFKGENQAELLKLIESCFFLGRLDDIYRVGSRALNDLNFEGEQKEDIGDLLKLHSVIDWNLFTPERKIILNPTFGKASRLVGGADADLIIDDTLVDIKVTQDLKLTRAMLNQVIGYYLLFTIGGIDGHPEAAIKSLGIYFARHGVLWKVSIAELGNEEQFSKVRKTLLQLVSDKKKKGDP